MSRPTLVSIIALSSCTPRNFASYYMRLLKSCNDGHFLRTKIPAICRENRVQNLLFCYELLCIQRCHERLVCRAEYRSGLANRVVADDIGEAGCILVYGRCVYEGLDGLYQRLAAIAGTLEGRSIFSGSWAVMVNSCPFNSVVISAPCVAASAISATGWPSASACSNAA